MPPWWMYVTDEDKHLAKSLKQGVSQIERPSDKIPPWWIYVTNEDKHLAKSLKQGVKNKKK